MRSYDIIVIGGGSAGSSAARTAHEAGARTLMINDGELGGLCILRGCMPTKTMLTSAHILHEARHGAPFGVHLEGTITPDFGEIMARKDRLVARFQRAKIKGVEAGGYEVLDARASLAPGGGVLVGDEVYEAKKIVLATGSVPATLPIPGLDEIRVLSSDDVMRLGEAPRSLVVQGAGPIGLELGQFFARLGTEVLLVNRSPLLSKLDVVCGAELTRALTAEPNFELAVPGRIECVRQDGDEIVFTLTDQKGTREHRAEAFLMAAGRDAAVDGLGVDAWGLGRHGSGVAHDLRMRSSHPDVYVAGDATGQHQILHLANQEGVVAGANAAGADPARVMDYRLKMTVVFSDPCFAHVGMTEAELADEGLPYVVGEARFPETGRAITLGCEFGVWRLYVHEETGEILGSAVLGPRADDLVHLISTLMHFRGGVDEILAMPWYHPTLSEVMLNLARSARSKMKETA